MTIKYQLNPDDKISIKPCNNFLFLQEELQESKDQYTDLERNLQQVNILEKKLLDKDSTVSRVIRHITKSRVQSRGWTRELLRDVV